MRIIQKRTVSNHQLIQEKEKNSEGEKHEIFIRYGKLITSRKYLSLISFLAFSLCLADSFQPLFNKLLGDFGVAVSTLTIVSGLTLLILLIFELILGAGTETEQLVESDNDFRLEYKFTPSINKLTSLLLFLAIGFFCIIFGFASLYGEFLRQDPSNFSGLQDGFLTIYFSLVTFSTVGYGDIYPVSLITRVAAMAEIFIAMFFSLVALSTTLSWVTTHEMAQREAFLKQRVEEVQKRQLQKNLLTCDSSNGKNTEANL